MAGAHAPEVDPQARYSPSGRARFRRPRRGSAALSRRGRGSARPRTRGGKRIGRETVRPESSSRPRPWPAQPRLPTPVKPQREPSFHAERYVHQDCPAHDPGEHHHPRRRSRPKQRHEPWRGEDRDAPEQQHDLQGVRRDHARDRAVRLRPDGACSEDHGVVDKERTGRQQHRARRPHWPARQTATPKAHQPQVQGHGHAQRDQTEGVRQADRTGGSAADIAPSRARPDQARR